MLEVSGRWEGIKGNCSNVTLAVFFFQNSGYNLVLCFQSHWPSVVLLICVTFVVM